MSKPLGHVASANAQTTGLPDTDESTEPGDAVTIDDGDLEPAGDTDDLTGIRARGLEAGADYSVVLDGVVIANVATGVEAGDDLDTSATAGQLEASSGGPVHALSDEGGEWKGAQLPDNAAAVKVN